MKSYTVKLTRDMDESIRLELNKRGIIIEYEGKLMKNIIIFKTSLDEKEISKLDFINNFHESVVGRLC